MLLREKTRGVSFAHKNVKEDIITRKKGAPEGNCGVGTLGARNLDVFKRDARTQGTREKNGTQSLARQEMLT